MAVSRADSSASVRYGSPAACASCRARSASFSQKVGALAGNLVAAPCTLYRAHMGRDHEAEIRASVGARHDLGPGYDDAVAEGLVERIGAEIDKRIDARLGPYGAPVGPPYGPYFAPPGPSFGPPPRPPVGAQDAYPAEPGAPGVAAAPQGYPAPSGYPPAGYHGYPGYPGYPGYSGYPGYPGYQGYQAQVPAARASARSAGQHSVAMTVIALGSMTLGVAATAIVAHAQHGGQAVMVLLIWAAIAIVNIAYARRC